MLKDGKFFLETTSSFIILYLDSGLNIRILKIVAKTEALVAKPIQLANGKLLLTTVVGQFILDPLNFVLPEKTVWRNFATQQKRKFFGRDVTWVAPPVLGSGGNVFFVSWHGPRPLFRIWNEGRLFSMQLPKSEQDNFLFKASYVGPPVMVDDELKIVAVLNTFGEVQFMNVANGELGAGLQPRQMADRLAQ